MKWPQQATPIGWKKWRSIKNIHFYGQNYDHILCRLTKQASLFLRARIKVNCVPSCIQNCVTVSFVSCWVSAFYVLPFCFGSFSHTFSYSFISLEDWTSFTFPSLLSYPYGRFSPLYFLPLSFFMFPSVLLSLLIRPYMNFAASTVAWNDF